MTDKRGAYWPWLLTLALLFTVSANVVMLFAANSDRNGSVVEPDYYRKAVAWDSTMARRAASDRLGWRAVATVERSVAGAASEGEVVVRITDAAGAAVQGAKVTATLIHNLDAGRPTLLRFRESPGRGYAARTRIAHPGRWEVRIEAERDGAQFLATEIVDAREGPALGPRVESRTP